MRSRRKPRATFTGHFDVLESRALLSLGSIPPSLPASMVGPVSASQRVPNFIVTSLTTDPSGFTAQFNRAFDASVLNLYGTQSAGLGPSDVTLIGQKSGPVVGSLVLGSSQDSFRFLKTGGVLPDDTYTIQIRSGADAFKDTSGILLDGNADGLAGDDFMMNFTVAQPSNVATVSVPDVTRGPGQAVYTPANTMTGMPLTLSNVGPVTSLDVTIRFDPSKLVISGATLAPGIPGTLASGGTGPDFVRFLYTTPTPLGAGSRTLFHLIAGVPGSAPYGSGMALSLESVSVNDGATPAIGDSGLFGVAYVGDADGSRDYGAYDASLIARVGVFLDSGFAAYPLIDPTVIADVDGSGDLGSSDASQVAAKAAFLSVPRIPDVPPPDGGQGAGASLGLRRPFPDDNPWNQDISQAPVDPNSQNLIASIGLTTTLHPDFGTVWNGVPNGIPYMVVPGNQPFVPIHFTQYGSESDPGPYPIPPDAQIEGGPNDTGDRHVLVVDKGNWKLYELFHAYPNADGSWDAGGGAIFDLNSNALRPAGWTSADAAGLPIFAGLVTYDQVMLQGLIRHALRFTVANTRAAYVAPATHYASSSTDPNLPPMGMRVRLKASFDITPFPAPVQIILKALKTYGMFVADNGANWFISGAPDPRWDDGLLAYIKYVQGQNFEVVQMGQITTGGNANGGGSGSASTSSGGGIAVNGQGAFGGAGLLGGSAGNILGVEGLSGTGSTSEPLGGSGLGTAFPTVERDGSATGSGSLKAGSRSVSDGKTSEPADSVVVPWIGSKATSRNLVVADGGDSGGLARGKREAARWRIWDRSF